MLKALVAVTCIAVLATIGWFFTNMILAERAKTQTIEDEMRRRAAFANCTEHQKEAARSYALFGERSALYGYPDGKETYPDCLPIN